MTTVPEVTIAKQRDTLPVKNNVGLTGQRGDVATKTQPKLSQCGAEHLLAPSSFATICGLGPA
jgi:hypothetical protein